MSHWAEKTPPEGTFRFALWRPDWNPEVRYEERNYGEVRHSHCLPWPAGAPLPARPPGRVDTWLPCEEDRTTCVMFVNDPHLRTRMCKLGWLDATEAWLPAPAKPEPARVLIPAMAIGDPVAPVAPSRARRTA